MTLDLLASLWLREPDALAVERAVKELGFPAASPAELAVAYADAILMNVPPYGTAFTDPSGELNGPGADVVASIFESTGFAPDALYEVGAADHLGLCLLHVAAHERDLVGLAAWGPICCRTLAELPGVHPFYRALAERTLSEILARSPAARLEVLQSTSDEAPAPIVAEASLSELLRFFLAPARSGVFIPRAELGAWARALDLALPFGSRWDVAHHLFTAAGEWDRLSELLDRLAGALGSAASAYEGWAAAHERWRPHAHTWIARTSAARAIIEAMRSVSASSRDG